MYAIELASARLGSERCSESRRSNRSSNSRAYQRRRVGYHASPLIVATNHKTTGIYLPAEDRRHYVAWSELKKADFADDYWSKLWDWYDSGGDQHVAPRIWLNLILHPLTLKRRRPRPKPSGTSLMPTGLLKILSLLTCSIRWVIPEPRHFKVIPKAMTDGFKMWLRDRSIRRAIPHRFEQCGYAPVRNPDREDRLWKVPVQPVDATLGVRRQ